MNVLSSWQGLDRSRVNMRASRLTGISSSEDVRSTLTSDHATC